MFSPPTNVGSSTAVYHSLATVCCSLLALLRDLFQWLLLCKIWAEMLSILLPTELMPFKKTPSQQRRRNSRANWEQVLTKYLRFKRLMLLPPKAASIYNIYIYTNLVPQVVPSSCPHGCISIPKLKRQAFIYKCPNTHITKQ